MKVHPKIVDRIVEAIKASETICVVGHVRPDGDCIGSQLGLTLALQNAGKNVTCWNQDPVPAKLAFLDPKKLIQQPEKGRQFDCVIATDCASLERLGTVVECIQERKLLINIDHHTSNTRYGDMNWIAAREPSTGELIFRLLKAANWPITPAISDCLFTAVSTDTGSFQYPTTRPATYHVAGELVKRGANLEKICDEVYQSYPLARVRLLRHVYNRLFLVEENRLHAHGFRSLG
jgi:phosphoesterase RecJ-like protein